MNRNTPAPAILLPRGKVIATQQPLIRYTYELVPYSQPAHPDVYFLSQHVRDTYHSIIELCAWAGWFPDTTPYVTKWNDGYILVKRIIGTESEELQKIYFNVLKNNKHV